MSLINDMLRDLDARRAPSVSSTMTALPATGVIDSHTNRQNTILFTVGTVLLIIVILAIMLSDKAPILFAGEPAPTIISAPIIKTADIPVGTGLPANKTNGTQASRLQGAPATVDIPVGAGLPANKPINLKPQNQIVRRTLSPEQQLARTFHDASTAAGSGDTPTAIRLLEDILTQDNNHHEARFLLANLHIRQQHNANATTLLSNGLARYPLHVPSAHLLARLLVIEERYSEAISHLQAALGGATQNADYHALLAGLYQRTGKPDAAAEYFTLALELSPKHGEWWMGLGISQEQAGNAIAAQRAYQQALQHPLQTNLQHYINQRLQKLSGKV